MKKIFLSASFADVAEHFKRFIESNSTEKVHAKTVTFINTASQVEEIRCYVNRDKQALESLGMHVDEFDISDQSADIIQAKIQQNDYLYIEGGNTFYLLQQLKATGADRIIIDQINQGKPYIGCSAGTVILAPNIAYIEKMDDVRLAPLLNDYTALSILDFYPLPHYDNEPFKAAATEILQQYQYEYPLVTLSNDQFIAIYEN